MNRRRKLRAATRGSALALWQTHHVSSLLGVEVEFVIVQTAGDKTQQDNTPIEAMAGQGVFVKEVQAAVLDGRADFAVHSAKDLPSVTAGGLALASIPERGDARDALVGSSLADLPQNGSVATGSVRRRAQLAALRPDLRFANLRGNIDTRLLKAKDFDAIVIANAALVRLERRDVEAYVLDPSTLLPQVGQGALAGECRADDEEMIQLLSAIEHRDSRLAVDAERAFLATLGGGCDLPVGAYATVSDDDITLRALMAAPDGTQVLRSSATGTDPKTLGTALGRELLDQHGGAQLIATRAKS